MPMPMPINRGVLRPMRPEHVAAVVQGQEPAAVEGLAAVFPQDLHPFPREVITQRWHAELQDRHIDCWVISRDVTVSGFAAVRADEVMHFGIALEEWGSGLAVTAHDELVERFALAGVGRPWLRVYAGNARGRAFWEKLGWAATGERTRGGLPPHAELLTYQRRPDSVRNPA